VLRDRQRLQEQRTYDAQRLQQQKAKLLAGVQSEAQKQDQQRAKELQRLQQVSRGLGAVIRRPWRRHQAALAPSSGGPGAVFRVAWRLVPSLCCTTDDGHGD
jgi:hypothetical protein